MTFLPSARSAVRLRSGFVSSEKTGFVMRVIIGGRSMRPELPEEDISVDAPAKLFLSYARGDDEPFARRLYGDLNARGFRVWFDRISMPSRQLTFHQEIRDAVADCDRLVLVVGPKAVTSDYVQQEWRFAYFEVDKCVNPIVRLDDVSSSREKIDGYELIPEDLKLLHAEDFRDDARYTEHLENLVRQLSEPPPRVGKLVAVPRLPPPFLRASRSHCDVARPAAGRFAEARRCQRSGCPGGRARHGRDWQKRPGLRVGSPPGNPPRIY